MIFAINRQIARIPLIRQNLPYDRISSMYLDLGSNHDIACLHRDTQGMLDEGILHRTADDKINSHSPMVQTSFVIEAEHLPNVCNTLLRYESLVPGTISNQRLRITLARQDNCGDPGGPIPKAQKKLLEPLRRLHGFENCDI